MFWGNLLAFIYNYYFPLICWLVFPVVFEPSSLSIWDKYTAAVLSALV